jgi:hypothetical protein
MYVRHRDFLLCIPRIDSAAASATAGVPGYLAARPHRQGATSQKVPLGAKYSNSGSPTKGSILSFKQTYSSRRIVYTHRGWTRFITCIAFSC